MHAQAVCEASVNMQHSCNASPPWRGESFDSGEVTPRGVDEFREEQFLDFVSWAHPTTWENLKPKMELLGWDFSSNGEDVTSDHPVPHQGPEPTLGRGIPPGTLLYKERSYRLSRG